ncbi:AAA family ATPase [Pseudomonas syringae]
MLTALDIKNFKAFSEWQSLTLAPITLIYGPNSSGKSSIIHSIMLLKQ